MVKGSPGTFYNYSKTSSRALPLWIYYFHKKFFVSHALAFIPSVVDLERVRSLKDEQGMKDTTARLWESYMEVHIPLRRITGRYLK
jgi:hypothetical protein